MGGKGSGGYNRKSVVQHLKDGTYRADRHGPLPKKLAAKRRFDSKVKQSKSKAIKKPILVTYSPIAVPPYFDKYAINEWERVCKILFDQGTLQDVNHATLEGYCSAYSTAVKATQHINTKGFTNDEPITDRDGEIIGYKNTKRPEVDISIKAWAQVKMFAVELGITSWKGPVKDTRSELERFLDTVPRP